MAQATDTRPLTADQQRAVALLDSGKNVLITGPAGTGKTFCLNRWLATKNFAPGEVAITASTGIAATHLNGMTIHSWSGVGIGDKTAERITGGFWWRENVLPRIKAAKVIVIDEISMLDGRMFELIGEVVGLAKGSLVPWHGVQVVLVGDMGQLSPVEEEQNGFCFETDQWWDLGIEVCELTQVMRQSDATFVSILRQVRDGVLSWESEAWLNTRVRAFDPDHYEAVRLMTHNSMVDAINDGRLGRLPGQIVELTAREWGKAKYLKMLDSSCLSPRVLRLKEGARVMFTKNASDGSYSNGSLGRVTGFIERDIEVSRGMYSTMERMLCVRVRLDAGYDLEVPQLAEWKLEGNDEEATEKKGLPALLARRTQYPLRLAWAITVHKSQGMTLDLVSVDLEHCFAPGQAYVALSRARSIEGLNIERWQGARSIIAHPIVREFTRGTYVLPSRKAQPPPQAQAPAMQTWPVASTCSVCRQGQINTPFGISCPNGHGGALALEELPAKGEQGACPTCVALGTMDYNEHVAHSELDRAIERGDTLVGEQATAARALIDRVARPQLDLSKLTAPPTAADPSEF